MPDFGSEFEEALWWENNQATVLNKFKHASEEGTFGRETLSGRTRNLSKIRSGYQWLSAYETTLASPFILGS